MPIRVQAPFATSRGTRTSGNTHVHGASATGATGSSFGVDGAISVSRIGVSDTSGAGGGAVSCRAATGNSTGTGAPTVGICVAATTTGSGSGSRATAPLLGREVIHSAPAIATAPSPTITGNRDRRPPPAPAPLAPLSAKGILLGAPSSCRAINFDLSVLAPGTGKAVKLRLAPVDLAGNVGKPADV
ncbi:MAG: hypothetical protein H7067_01980, partial [Burkholderiales bacterium]|nr:hypothetical protein [Opitutaceae bacterium]